MEANEILSQKDWRNIAINCQSYTSDFLVAAINAARQQAGKSVIDSPEYVSHQTLVNIVYKIIKQTNKCDKLGSLIWIDSDGKYVIPTNREITINKLPIGTKLMWDAPLNPHINPHQRITYPAIVTDRHWLRKWIKIKTQGTSQWMGPKSEFLRLPTSHELKTHSWPST